MESRRMDAKSDRKAPRLLTGWKHKLMVPAMRHHPQQYCKSEGRKPVSERVYVDEEPERRETKREGLASEDCRDFEAVNDINQF